MGQSGCTSPCKIGFYFDNIFKGIAIDVGNIEMIWQTNNFNVDTIFTKDRYSVISHIHVYICMIRYYVFV